LSAVLTWRERRESPSFANAVLSYRIEHTTVDRLVGGGASEINARSDLEADHFARLHGDVGPIDELNLSHFDAILTRRAA
jgi:hypothetical protein